jgi:hypothetical protein
MPYQIEWRAGTAAQWTSANPTLGLAEKGVETDTGQFKIGTGSTPWNSLAYNGKAGPAQVYAYRSFGDGSDGNYTQSSGVLTITRDMFYNNLTINGTGQINSNNFKIFVKGTLDLTAAGVGALNNNGDAGSNGTNGASGGAGGTPSSVDTSGTLGATNPGNGGNGSANNGSAGTGSAALTGNGGGQNGSSTGGIGLTGTAGAAGASSSPTVLLVQRYETNFLRGISLIGGGGSAGGGGGGGGDGTFVGGGGGSGGMGGGALIIYANNIVKSSLTPVSCIQAIGGNGGNGGNGDPAGGTGGGGGAGSGSGGWIALYYNNQFGPTISGMLDVSSGRAGNGGIGYNGGVSAKGGNAGNAGVISIYQVPTGLGSKLVSNEFFAAGTWDSQLLGGVVINNIPGSGGLAQILTMAF